jgi:hypothetical protein
MSTKILQNLATAIRKIFSYNRFPSVVCCQTEFSFLSSEDCKAANYGTSEHECALYLSRSKQTKACGGSNF